MRREQPPLESRNSLVRDPSVVLSHARPGEMSAASSPVRAPGEHLLGRRREREVLDRLLEAARGGHGGVLVVHGEPGVGKTALLEYAVEAGREFRVVRTLGVEEEMELPYAALQQLCSPLLELLERLPQPQRDALRRRVRTQRRAGAEPVPGRAGGPRPAVRGRRGAAAALRGRRRAVARSCVGARARVRGSPPVGGEGRARVRGARAGRRARRVAGASRRALGASRRAGAVGVRLAGSRSMSACWSGSSSRRAGIRSLCWSCRAS